MPPNEAIWSRWDEVDALLAEALERPEADRQAWVESAASGDVVLRDTVLRLLGRLTTQKDRLTTPPGGLVAAAFGAPVPAGDADLAPGTEVDRYVIVRRHARGGMATVYEAERADGAYRQRVALKVLRRGLDTEDVVRRFLTERQILSSLAHPNIARLLDGGSTADGRPFLVMELVEGDAITTFAEERRLDIDARLRLFLQVADAVHAAHTRLVVHRDIKPSNILVDVNGQVKLLDFGIAKLLADDADSAHTHVGARAMTPDYASPEQLHGGPITTATDVYQLGLLLRELLSGERPAKGSGAAQRLPSDLEIIVGTALREEPLERYASASEMASDVRRHMTGLPIAAHPESRRYRARKFVKRHRWGVAASAMTLLALVGYALTITVQSRRIAAERDRAEREARKAAEVTEFLVQLFQSADPNETRGESITARELLDRGAAMVDGGLHGEPAVRAAMLSAMGRSYRALGLFDQARPLLERAEAEWRSAPEWRAGDELLRRSSAADLSVLATLVSRGDPARGLEMFAEARERAERAGGPEDPLVARILTDYAAVLGRARPDAQERHAMLSRAVAILRKAPGDNRRDLAHALTVSAYGREPEDAIPLMSEGLALRRSVYGELHSATATSLSDLALVTEAVDPLAADTLMLQALEILETLHGRRHATTLAVMNNLAGLRRDRGAYAEAAPLYREVLALRRELYPTEVRSHAYALYGLGLTLVESGDPLEGERRLREALRILRTSERPDSPLLSLTRAALGYGLARQRRFAEAEPLLVGAYREIRMSRLSRREQANAARRVLWLYEEWGRPAAAEAYREELAELSAERDGREDSPRTVSPSAGRTPASASSAALTRRSP